MSDRKPPTGKAQMTFAPGLKTRKPRGHFHVQYATPLITRRSHLEEKKSHSSNNDEILFLYGECICIFGNICNLFDFYFTNFRNLCRYYILCFRFNIVGNQLLFCTKCSFVFFFF